MADPKFRSEPIAHFYSTADTNSVLTGHRVHLSQSAGHPLQIPSHPNTQLLWYNIDTVTFT